MNSKTLSMLTFGILAVILLANLISATLTFQSVPAISKTSNSIDITIISDKDETATFSGLSSITQGGQTITFAVPAPVVLTANTPRTFTVNYNIPSGFNFLLGKTYSTSITATGSISSAVPQTLSFDKVNYCSLGNKGDLTTTVDIDNVKGFGDDDEWYPGDEVTISVDVKNNRNEKVNDIIIKWGLYNPKTGEWIIDDEEKQFDVKSSTRETKEITFTIDPKDLDSSTEDYILYVKAYSDYDGEGIQCGSYSEDIKINIEDNFVILDDIKTTPEIVPCDSQVQLTANVWNIGSEDQSDVYVVVHDDELKLNQKFTVGDIDSFRSKKLTMTLNIPAELKEKIYDLQIDVYDEDNAIYSNGNDDNSKFLPTLKVEGNCAVAPKAFITADLQSGGQSGKELVIKSTVKNIGDSTATYAATATGYESWSTLSSVEPQTFTLKSGESKEVLYKFSVNKATEGDQTFSIVLSTGPTDKEKLNQPVTVTIQKSGFSFPGITGLSVSNNNWYLWGIGILNVILVIIIIIVAMRIARG